VDTALADEFARAAVGLALVLDGGFRPLTMG